MSWSVLELHFIYCVSAHANLQESVPILAGPRNLTQVIGFSSNLHLPSGSNTPQSEVVLGVGCHSSL